MNRLHKNLTYIVCIFLIGSSLTHSLAYLLWTENNYRVSGFQNARESNFFVDEIVESDEGTILLIKGMIILSEKPENGNISIDYEIINEKECKISYTHRLFILNETNSNTTWTFYSGNIKIQKGFYFESQDYKLLSMEAVLKENSLPNKFYISITLGVAILD